MTTPAIVQALEPGMSTAATYNFTLPNPPTVGNVLVIVASNASNLWGFSTPTGFTQRIALTPNFYRLYAFTRIVQSGDGQAYSLNQGSSISADVAMYEVGPVQAGNEIVSVNSVSWGLLSNTLEYLNLPLLLPESFVLGLGSHYNTPTGTIITGFTQRIYHTTGGGMVVGTASRPSGGGVNAANQWGMNTPSGGDAWALGYLAFAGTAYPTGVAAVGSEAILAATQLDAQARVGAEAILAATQLDSQARVGAEAILAATQLDAQARVGACAILVAQSFSLADRANLGPDKFGAGIN